MAIFFGSAGEGEHDERADRAYFTEYADPTDRVYLTEHADPIDRAYLTDLTNRADGHTRYMSLALQLARATQGQTSPNPPVGAVVVNGGKIVGIGAHLAAGQPHAEVHALQMAGQEASGATLYVTLEPCNHHGRTPPCTEAIITSGVRKVVVGSTDANPAVNGAGLARLREAGIDVVTGVLQRECATLNEAFFHYMTTKRPFVTVKTASTLDGKIATKTGDSRWVTGEQARAYVHRLRHVHDAVMVGIGTVLADNPLLTTRLPEGGRDAVRVVVDSQLRTPLEAYVCDTSQAPTWIFCTERRDRGKEAALAARGVRVFTAGAGPRVDLSELFAILGREHIVSVLVEGGSALNGSLLEGRFVNKVVAMIAPKLIGGRDSMTSYGGVGSDRMNDALSLSAARVHKLGNDLCVEGYVSRPRAGGDRHIYRDN